MSVPKIPDEVWREVRPLLPRPPRRADGRGRPRSDDRACLAGVVYVLRTGCAWNRLPAREVGASGPTCWRRLAAWTAAGVWPRLHRRLLAALARAGRPDPSAACVDSQSVRALTGGRPPARARSTGRSRAASGT